MKDSDKTINYLNNSNDSNSIKSTEEEITEPLISSNKETLDSNQNNKRQDFNNLNSKDSFYCPQCGYLNISNANFCGRCGSSLNITVEDNLNNSYQNEKPRQFSDSQSYQKLGGFLGFLVYATIVLSSLSILNLSYVFYYHVFVDRIFIYNSTLMIRGILNLSIYIIWCIFYIWLSLQIKKRNPNFLKDYDFGAITLVILEEIKMVIIGASFLSCFFDFVYSFILIFLLTTYFVKSKRVRNYFGSTDYIYLNPLTKRFAH